MTAYRYAVIGCKLKQNANEGCNSCASLAGLVLCFIACFILLVIAPLDDWKLIYNDQDLWSKSFSMDLYLTITYEM